MKTLCYCYWLWVFVRSSHRSCSVAKGVLGNFAKFTGKHLCQSLFFNKVAGWDQNISGWLLLICQAVFLCQLPLKSVKTLKHGWKIGCISDRLLGHITTYFQSFSFKITMIIIHFGLHNILLSLIFMHEVLLYFSFTVVVPISLH